MTGNSDRRGGLPAWIAAHLDEILAWGPAPMARGCIVHDCQREAHLHGLCKTHYRRAERTWHPRPSHKRYGQVQASDLKRNRKPSDPPSGALPHDTTSRQTTDAHKEGKQ